MRSIIGRWVRALGRNVVAAGASARLLVLVVAIVLTASSARAQFGFGTQMADMADTITKRGAKAYAEILKLDDAQRESMMTLLDGHRTAQHDLMKKMQEKLQELQQKAQETGDWSVFQNDWPKQAIEIGNKSEALEKGFFADLRGLLTPEQDDRWSKLERHRRREKNMRFGFASGAAADLMEISRRVNAVPAGPAGGEFSALAEQYENEMDRVMVMMEKKNDDTRKGMAEPGMMMNPAKIGDMMKEYYDIARQGRDINRDYARRLMPLMSDEARGKFDQEMKRRSFPRVYKESYTEKAIKAAMAMDDLDATQKDAVKTLRDGYVRERAPIDEKWAKAIEAQEEEAGGSINVMMRGFMGQNAGKDNPVKEVREARVDLDSKTTDKLKSVLNEKQRAKLPEKKVEPMNPMADMMPNEDGGDEE